MSVIGWVVLPAGCPDLSELAEEYSTIDVFTELRFAKAALLDRHRHGARIVGVTVEPENVVDRLAELVSDEQVQP